MEFEIWHYWVIAAFGFFVLEVFIPGFILGSLGIGCILASLGAFFGLSLGGNIILLVIGFLIGILMLKPILKRFDTKTTVKTNADGLIGKVGKVIEEINVSTGTGRVLVDGDDWKAVAFNNSVVGKDVAVEIIALDSIIVTVKQLQKQNSEPIEPLIHQEPVAETLKNNTGLIVNIGTRKEVIRHEEILCFYSSQKIAYLVIKNGKQVVVDDSLEKLEEQLGNQKFFRANRQFIITANAVKDFQSDENGKTKVTLIENQYLPNCILISRLKSHTFRKWIKMSV